MELRARSSRHEHVFCMEHRAATSTAAGSDEAAKLRSRAVVRWVVAGGRLNRFIGRLDSSHAVNGPAISCPNSESKPCKPRCRREIADIDSGPTSTILTCSTAAPLPEANVWTFHCANAARHLCCQGSHWLAATLRQVSWCLDLQELAVAIEHITEGQCTGDAVCHRWIHVA